MSTRSQRLLVSVLVPLASLAVAHADVRVVAPTGAPYAEIQVAVDAANDGDLVLVKAGTYASFVIRNQEVAVVADAGAVVQVAGAIRVSGVGATRTVLLQGLRATGTMTPQSSTRHGLFARNCAGSLRVVGCELTGLPLNLGVSESCYEGQGAYLENCADAAFVGCTVKGSEAPPTAAYYGTFIPDAGNADGGHGIFADVSTLTVYDSQARGGRSGIGGAWGGYGQCDPPPFSQFGYLGAAGEGLRMQGSFVFASNATITGAAGWNSACWEAFCGCYCASTGGDALVHDGGAALGFLLACNLTPGQGGLNSGYCACGISIGACAPGCCPGSPMSCIAASGDALSGSLTQFAGLARRAVATPVAREGQPATLEFHGQPGDRVELLMSERTGRQFVIGARGVNLVRRSRPQLVQQAGTIGPSGVLTQTWTVGELGPGVESRTHYLQAAMIDGAGVTTLSSPGVIVLLDSGF